MICMVVIPVHADYSIDFEGYPNPTPVSALNYPGVTFSGEYRVINTPGGPFFDGGHVDSVVLGADLTIEFDKPQSGFSLDVYGGHFFAYAYLNNQLVWQHQYLTVYFGNSIGISGIIFDKIVMSDPVLNNSYRMDNLVTWDAPATVTQSAMTPPDDRLNWHYGDATIAILYPGDNAVDVYDYATESYIFNFITADDIPDEPPAENTIIRQEGHIMASILTTGEIQFNLGPDAEGKSYVFIMGDIYGSDNYGFKYDPNE